MQEYIKKKLGSDHNHPSHNTTLISNDEINNIKKVKSLEDSGLLLKVVTETVKNEEKEQKASFSFTFSITSGFVKRFLKTIRNKKKKHNKIVMLVRSKLNSIENKISKALTEIMKLVMKTLKQLLMKKKNFEN